MDFWILYRNEGRFRHVHCTGFSAGLCAQRLLISKGRKCKSKLGTKLKRTLMHDLRLCSCGAVEHQMEGLYADIGAFTGNGPAVGEV